MKTQQELQLHYWGLHYDMVKEYNAKHGTNIQPWECVKYKGCIAGVLCDFSNDHSVYEFALTILYDDKLKEHRPVFVGDKVYHKEYGIEREIVSGNLVSDFAEKFSWNPPTPKRTFKLNDMELPCPTYKEGGYMLEITCNYDLYRMNNVYIFDSAKDRDEVEKALHNLLAPGTRSRL